MHPLFLFLSIFFCILTLKQRKMLTENEIAENRKRILKLLYSVKREGIKDVIDFLFTTNFFYANGGHRHHRYVGGLAEHSLGVYDAAAAANKNCSIDSIIICSLFHDLCKINTQFGKTVKNGHGRRSLSILEDHLGFKLTPEERRAIRFHMGKRSNITEESEEYEIAQQEELWNLIHTSDSIDAGHYPPHTQPIVRGVMKILGL